MNELERKARWMRDRLGLDVSNAQLRQTLGAAPAPARTHTDPRDRLDLAADEAQIERALATDGATVLQQARADLEVELATARARVEARIAELCKDPVLADGVGAELDALNAARADVIAQFTPPSPAGARRAEERLAALPSTIKATRDAIVARQGAAAAALREAARKLGEDPGLALGLDTDRQEVGAALATLEAGLEPLSNAALSAAEDAREALAKLVTTVTARITARLEATAKALRARASTLREDPALHDTTASERASVDGVLADMEAALKTPAPATLEEAERLLGTVPGAIAAAAKQRDQRWQKAEGAIRASLRLLLENAGLADAEPHERAPVDALAQGIDSCLKVPSNSALAEAEEQLPALEKAIAAARDAIALRLGQAAAGLLALIAPQGELGAAPPGALAHQSKQLAQLRDALRKPLETKPLSAALLEHGRLARDALRAAQDKTAAAVARLGGTAVAQKLAGAIASEAELAAFIDTGFGGDTAALGALFTKGCGGDVERLEKVHAACKGDLAGLHGLLENGGLAARPEVLAALVEGAFKAEAAKAFRQKDEAAKALGSTTPTAPLDSSERAAADTKAAAQLHALVASFADPKDGKRLASLLDAGGLGTRPAVFASLLQTGCGGNADELKKITTALGSAAQPGETTTELQNLAAVLDRGGLATRPDMLGHMFATGCGKDAGKLRDFCAAFAAPNESAKLDDLVRKGGLAQGAERLAQVYAEGLKGDPGSLKKLHESFNGGPPSGADLAKLRSALDAFAAPPPETAPQSLGTRFARVLTNMQVIDKHTGAIDASRVGELKTVFVDKLEKNTRGGAARGTEDLITRSPRGAASLDAANALTRLAKANAASPETQQAAVTGGKLASATAGALLAGNAIAAEFAEGSATCASTLAQVATLGLRAAPHAAAQRAALQDELELANGNVEAETLAKLLAAAEKARNDAAAQANNTASAAFATLKGNATAANVKAAADAARLVVEAVARATDTTLIATALALVGDIGAQIAAATVAAGKACATARLATAATAVGNGVKGTSLASNSAAHVTAAIGSWKPLLADAGNAALASIVANADDARDKAVTALAAEAHARALTTDPTASEQDIANAQVAARAATQAADDAKADAARQALQALPAPTAASTQAELARLLACADATVAAATRASAAQKSAALMAAKTAYDNLYKHGCPNPPAPTGPDRRVMAAAAALQRLQSTGALSVDDLLRNSATFRHVPKTTVTEFTITPGGGASALDSRMEHYCGRHTREYFTFDAHELGPQDAVEKGLVVKAMTHGGAKTPDEQNLIKGLAEESTQTFFPEWVDEAKIKQYLEAAVKAVNAGTSGVIEKPSPASLVTLPITRALLDGLPGARPYIQVKNVAVGDGFLVTIGFGPHPTDAAKVWVPQMYPEPGPRLETIEFVDMNVIKSALKL